MSYRILPYGVGRYDIGPYAKEFLFQVETEPTTDWTERPDLNAERWIKRPDNTPETWISVTNGNN